MLDSFPTGFNARPEQVDIIRRIEEAANSDYQSILLCAPTGIGKSHIAATFARSHSGSHVITAQKMLQDQYSSDFPFMRPMKGKSNFACLMLHDMTGAPYRGGTARSNMTCAHGRCSWHEVDGKKATCEYKPKMQDFVVASLDGEKFVLDPPNSCLYYAQKYIAMLSPHTLYNYSAYFNLRRFAQRNTMVRACLVADEAHDIGNQLVSFSKCIVSKRIVEDAGYAMHDFRLRDVDGLKEMVRNMLLRITGMTRRAGQDDPKLPSRLVMQEQLQSIYYEMSEKPDNIVWKQTSNSVTIMPVDTGHLARRFFDATHCLFMSATIHPDVFCREMGIDERDSAFIEVKKSPFEAQSRPVKFMDVARLGYGTEASVYGEIYGTVAKLMARHRHEKGLILTTSKRQCSDVMPYMSPEDRERTIVAHGDVAGGQAKAVKRHKESKRPTVLLSPSLWYGVDLKDDLSRFQIIVKTPYPSLSDVRISAKNKISPVWYQYEALMRLLQGLGRSVRTRNDHAVSYILDTTSHTLVKKMRRFIPPPYEEVLA